MKQLRVVQLVTTFSLGGAQATVLESAVDAPEDIGIEILAGPDDLGEGDLWAEARARGVSISPVPNLHRSIRPVSDTRTLIWLVRDLRRRRPDVLHTHSAKAGVLGRVAGRVLGIPVVHTVHGWSFRGISESRRLVRFLVVVLERLLARFTALLVVVTEVDRVEGLEHRIGRSEQYRTIRSGLDLESLRSPGYGREWARGRLGLDSGQFVVGTVARLAAAKHLETMVEGFARSGLADEGATLCVIGGGDRLQPLVSLARELGIRGSLHVEPPRTDAARLITAFDVFALTSLWEGLPRALIEAMALGVPVVSTPVGGIPEIVVDEQSGLLVPSRDPAALAVAMRRLHSDPDLRRRLADDAARRVEEFSVQRMRARLHDAWREAAMFR